MNTRQFEFQDPPGKMRYDRVRLRIGDIGARTIVRLEDNEVIEQTAVLPRNWGKKQATESIDDSRERHGASSRKGRQCKYSGSLLDYFLRRPD